MNLPWFIMLLALSAVCAAASSGQSAVPDNLQFGLGVPPAVEQITKKALEYLVENQQQNGSWDGGYDSHGKGRENCGVVGLALMAMLSTGEDPNSGPYAESIRSALRYIITTQNAKTGFLPNTMYNHGFGMLALAEAYGAVDDNLIWKGLEAKRQRTVGEALTLAVQLAVLSQEKNPQKAWRYLPTSRNSDTSVTGAVLVGLLAARNAGVAVPDASLEGALSYLEDMTSRKSGNTLYTSALGAITGGSSLSAITALTMSIGGKQYRERFLAASKRVKEHVDLTDQTFPFYNMYYMAQALFQTDYESWERWNKITVRRLRRQQNADGSFDSRHSKVYATAMASLALALNYRLLPIYER